MKIFLVRHGESEANAKDLYQGQRLDSPLSSHGLEQAQRIAERLKDEKIDAIYSSDLLRARETAEAIAKFHNLKVITDRRLREFDLGDFGEKENRWELLQAHKKAESVKRGITPWEVEAIGGESEFNHFKRTDEFFRELIKKPYEGVCVVSHGGTNKVFFGTIGHASRDTMYSIPQKNCCLNEIEYSGGLWVVKKINCLRHLEK